MRCEEDGAAGKDASCVSLRMQVRALEPREEVRGSGFTL